MDDDSSMNNELKNVLRTTLSAEFKRIGGFLVKQLKEDLVRCVQETLHSNHLHENDGKSHDLLKRSRYDKRCLPPEMEDFHISKSQTHDNFNNDSLPSSLGTHSSSRFGGDLKRNVSSFSSEDTTTPERSAVSVPGDIPLAQPPVVSPAPPFPGIPLDLEMDDCNHMSGHQVKAVFNLSDTAKANGLGSPQPPVLTKDDFSAEERGGNVSKEPKVSKRIAGSLHRAQARLAADLSEIRTLLQADIEEKGISVRGKTDLSSRFTHSVHSGLFDYVMGIVLCASAIVIGVETDVMVATPASERPLVFRVLSFVFLCIFTLELVVRLAIFRSAWFKMEGWQWNWLDIVVLAAFYLDELASALIDGTTAHEAITNFGFLRTLKFGRIVRIFRMVRLIPELKAMVYLIAASMMYVLALYYTDSAMLLLQGESPNPALSEMWGSIGSSVYSLFQAITGGDDWCNIVGAWNDSSYSKTSMANTMIFCVYIAFATLVMLNLVTGVFVEGAQRLVSQDRDKEIIKQARRLFVSMGGDEDTSLNEDTFLATLDAGKLDCYLKAVDLRRDEAENLFLVLDSDNSGTLTLDEFLLGTIRLRGVASAVDSTVIKQILQMVQGDIVSVSEFIGSMQKQLNSISEQTRLCNAVAVDLRKLRKTLDVGGTCLPPLLS
eukprot:TRINITY_DN14226_c0_g1_i2.p1 TRINITY_DN14226_c0_g1~~TRINITY_DN14226_c0_g1_i2.p1  ORF type:complete len:661 (+),score=113.39 TRINITY_DN14226_c0_g1_i2:124-2106(+)